MATFILGIAGAFIGGAIAGPAGATKGAMLGWSIGATIGGYIDMSNQHYPSMEMGKLNDLRVTSSAYGTFIPQCWGYVRVPGQLIWSTSLKEIEQDTHQGGKGGGGQTVKKYTYTVSMLLMMCTHGRMTGSSLKKIHADDQIIVDTSVSSSLWKTPSANVRFLPGGATQSADALIIAQQGSDAPAYRTLCCVMLQDFLLTDYGNRIPNFSIELDSGTVYVGDVISDVMAQVGIDTATELDVSAVSSGADNVVRGMALGGAASAKDCLQPVLSAYSTDLVDVDGVIRAVKRGGNPTFTIRRNDQGAYILGSGARTVQSRLQISRIQDIELPKSIDITYLSTTNALMSSTQRAVRQTAPNNNQVKISVPLSLDDTTARHIAERELYLNWLERTTYTTSVFPKYLQVCAADVGWLETDDKGTLKRVRVKNCELGLIGPIKLSLLPDNATLLSQSVSGGTPPTGGLLSSPVPTTFLAWSGREIRDSDTNAAGFYVAATGGTGWQGCLVYYSVDGGSNWIEAGVIGARAVFGPVTGALGSSYVPNGAGFDVTNTVQANLYAPGTMASTTETSVSNGGGNYGLVVKQDTSVDNSADYEVLGFATVTPNGGQLYTISDLLRSQRTTVATGHASTDTFVKLDSSVLRIAVATNLVHQVIKVVCVSPYQTLASQTGNAQNVYIATPNPVYTTVGDVTSITNGIPRPCYWRARHYVGGNLVPSTLDETYFKDSAGTPGANYPSFAGSAGQKNWTIYCAGPGGGWIYNTPGAGDVLWLRMKIQNTTAASITFDYRVTAWDNAGRVRFDGTFIYDNSTFNTTSTVTVPAGTTKLLELFYKNDPATYSSTDQGIFEFWMNAFDQAGLSFVDAGI